MSDQIVAVLVEDAFFDADELAASCMVDRAWIIEHVQAGVLLTEPTSNPETWKFSGADLLRARRIRSTERTFGATPEVAGLIADLQEEIARLRARLKRAGLDA